MRAGFVIDPFPPGLLNAGLLNAVSVDGCVVGAVVLSMGTSLVGQSLVQIGFSLQYVSPGPQNPN